MVYALKARDIHWEVAIDKVIIVSLSMILSVSKRGGIWKPVERWSIYVISKVRMRNYI